MIVFSQITSIDRHLNSKGLIIPTIWTVWIIVEHSSPKLWNLSHPRDKCRSQTNKQLVTACNRDSANIRRVPRAPRRARENVNEKQSGYLSTAPSPPPLQTRFLCLPKKAAASVTFLYSATHPGVCCVRLLAIRRSKKTWNTARAERTRCIME